MNSSPTPRVYSGLAQAWESLRVAETDKEREGESHRVFQNLEI